MNPSKPILTLAAILVPTLAIASGTEDPVLSSFNRDLQREPVPSARLAAFVEKDPLVEIFHAALLDPNNPTVHTGPTIRRVAINLPTKTGGLQTTHRGHALTSAIH